MSATVNYRFHVKSIGTNDITRQILPSRNNVVVVHRYILSTVSRLHRCSSFDREVTKDEDNIKSLIRPRMYVLYVNSYKTVDSASVNSGRNTSFF